MIPVITPAIIPYIIPYVTLLKEFRLLFICRGVVGRSLLKPQGTAYGSGFEGSRFQGLGFRGLGFRDLGFGV